MATDVTKLAERIARAYAQRHEMAPPSAEDSGLSIADAYEVERTLAGQRHAAGHATVGRKVGFANKAMWRALKLETLVWADMYDDTVHYAPGGAMTLPVGRMYSPKIEPEVVFRLTRPIPEGTTDPAAVLDAVEWIALGFEIIDCVFPGWKFQPADFIAAYGLHAALVVGEPRQVDSSAIPALVEQLPRFTLRLSKNGELVEEGSGKNSLRSPALCVAELAAAIGRQSGSPPLAGGELISSGTLTTSQPIAAGERWSAEVDGIDLLALTVTTAT